MLPKKRKRKNNDSDDDIDWKPVSNKPPKKDSTVCFIHCTDAEDDLKLLSSAEKWRKLLNAAELRNDEKVLDLAGSCQSENDFPKMHFHNRCWKVYTHSSTLESLSAKREVGQN